jgi:hypothetical protein
MIDNTMLNNPRKISPFETICLLYRKTPMGIFLKKKLFTENL